MKEKYFCGHRIQHVFIRKTKIAQDMAVYEAWKESGKNTCIQCFWKSLSESQKILFKAIDSVFKQWQKENKNVPKFKKPKGRNKA